MKLSRDEFQIIIRLVHQQLMKFLDENRLLSDFQFGFRPKMSTELAATFFSIISAEMLIKDTWLVLLSLTSARLSIR